MDDRQNTEGAPGDGEPQQKRHKDERELSQSQLDKVEKYRRLLRDPDSAKSQNGLASLQILDEKEHHFGDFVIINPNPDHKHYKYLNHYITIQDVVDDYDKIFNVDSVFPAVNYENELLRMAFLQCFQNLQDVDPEKLSKMTQLKRVEKIKNKKTKPIYFIQMDGKMAKANTLQKKYCGNSGFMKFDKFTDNWYRTGNNVQDYGSLIRMLLLIKISMIGGFFVRQFLSVDGENIYFVMYQENRNLLTEAQRTELNMQVGLCNCDLLSLEPVGRRLRPLRLNAMMTSTDKTTMKDKKMQVLKDQIQLLLKEIDYRKLCKEIGMPPYEASQEIHDDKNESRGVWTAYRYYLEQVRDGVQKSRQKYQYKSSIVNLSKTEITELIQAQTRDESHKEFSKKHHVVLQQKTLGTTQGINLKMVKAINKRKLSQEFQETFLEAMRLAQKKYGKLKNIWNLAGVSPLSPYVDYFNPNYHQNFNTIVAQEQIWERSILNVKGKHEIFLRMERQKLCSSILTQLVNLNHMQGKCDYVKKFFIPHNLFDTIGQNLSKFVDPITKALKLDPTILFSHHENQVLQGLVELVSKKKSSHHISPHDTKGADNKVVKEVVKKVKKTRAQKKQERRQIQKDKIRGGLNGTNLRREWGLFNIPIKQIRDYFGERIALYFDFAGFFQNYLFSIAFLGAVAFAVEMSFDDGSQQDRLCTILFSLSILVWCSLFNSNWANHETKFSIMYGQDDVGQDQTELIDFKGKAKRSLATDKMNDLYYPEWKTWVRFFFSVSGILILILFQVIIIVQLLKLMLKLGSSYYENDLETQDFLPENKFFYLDVAVPVFIWMILVLFFDAFFKPISFRLTKWENHKYLSSFEVSYIVKILLFSTITRLGLPLIISFISTRYVGCTNGGDCYEELQVYMRVAIFMQLIKTVVIQFIIPTFRFAALKTKRGVEYLLITKPSPLNKVESMYKKSPFLEINYFLEGESDKNSFAFNYELDGTIDQYLDLILQYGFLVNYGLSFPLVFIVALVTIMVQIKIDQLRLMEYTSKPIPLSANTLGVFRIYLDLMAYSAIFTNSGLMTFTNTFTFYQYQPKLLFVIFVFGFFAFKFFLDNVLAGGDKQMNDLYGRHQNIKKNIQAGFSRSRGIIHSNPQYPILKVYGTLLPDDKKYKKVDPIMAAMPNVNDFIVENPMMTNPMMTGNDQSGNILPGIDQGVTGVVVRNKTLSNQILSPPSRQGGSRQGSFQIPQQVPNLQECQDIGQRHSEIQQVSNKNLQSRSKSNSLLQLLSPEQVQLQYDLLQHPVEESIDQAKRQPVNQPRNQSINQPINQNEVKLNVK